ncbi:MAG: sugar phosphate isomerase/epimerase [Clostridia bacterium]|nr:sugar phosphate isomerase/epimerase [Clostridia bacterium]
MKISIQTAGAESRLGVDGAYRLFKECGFDGVDVNLDAMCTWNDIAQRKRPPLFTGFSDDDFKKAFDPWKNAARKYGLENFQAHAPFPSCVFGDDEYNEFMLRVLEKTIEAAHYIGCRRLVVHPFFYGYDHKLPAAEERAFNIKCYSRLIETARRNDVIICLENMFSAYRGRITAGCCSDISEACDYVDTLNEIAGERRFAFCLDTGHLFLLGLDVYDAMIKLGSRIEAFHVHDNDGRSDLHIAPYMGVIDWNKFIKGLRDIGFDSTMSFETVNVWNYVDSELCPQVIKLIADTGRMFARRKDEA